MVTKQRFKRLAALILVVAHGIVAGMPVHAGDWMPMLPSQDFYDFQLFAPPDLQDYEIYPEPSEGIFFNYDRLYWGITPPRVAGVGATQTGSYIIPTYPISPQTVVQLNNDNIAASGTSGVGSIIGGLYTFGSDPLQLDLNTSWMRTKMAWGNRYEGGWIYDNNGVNISYFNIGQSQSFQTNSEFAASSPTQTFTQTSTTGAWETYTSNNMVGPEFSLLFESQQGRWLFSSEFKFTAGLNWQNNLYRGANFPNSLGADYLRATFTPSTTFTAGGTTGAGANSPTTINAPPLFLQLYGVGQSNATNSAEHRFVFSPIGEWRFGTQFRVSEAIRLHAGYTGMWLGSVARASTNTGYITKEKRTQFAAPQDPTQPASSTNPWVVKNTGPSPGNLPTNADGTLNPYYVPNPRFNSVGPVQGGQEYVLTNGLDFGIEVRY